jgi:hypothetical protein
MSKYRYELFADYFQFYLQDEHADGNLGDSWTPQATEDRLALAPGTIGVGTARNMNVPVTIVVRDSAPEPDNFENWDHVCECSIALPSGRLVVAGCTDYFPDAARIRVTPELYRARIYYGDLDKLSDNGLEGDDHYHIVLWPADYAEPHVLKRYR